MPELKFDKFTAESPSNRLTTFEFEEYPIDRLTSSRQFEILVFKIFKEISEDSSNNFNMDNVQLMQGVGEQGVDCLLKTKGKISGVVQCKLSKDNINKPVFAKELIKFCIHQINSKVDIDWEDFLYIFVVSSNVSRPTLELINNIKNIINDENYTKWLKETLSEYEAFSGLGISLAKKKLKSVFSKIEIKHLIKQDLTSYLIKYRYLAEEFFKIRAVTDNSFLVDVVEKYLKPLLKNIIDSEEKHSVIEDFTEYLGRAYNKHLYAHTLVFGNKQIRLPDFYYPLRVSFNNFNNKNEFHPEYLMDRYSDDFLPRHKKILLIDNGGMGKSTILKWLFLSSLHLNKGIPIFLELRKLNKDNLILDEISKTLSPINKSISPNNVKDLLSEGRFILFLDGFDEITYANRKHVVPDIITFVEKAHKNLFIMSSRPEDELNSFGDFISFNIAPLSQDESFELIKKIGRNNERSRRLIDKLKTKNSVGREFLANPLLVSLLYKKFDFRESVPFVKQEFYFEVFEALFKAHDLTKGDSFIHEVSTQPA